MDGWMDGWCFLHRNELTNWLGFVRCVFVCWAAEKRDGREDPIWDWDWDWDWDWEWGWELFPVPSSAIPHQVLLHPLRSRKVSPFSSHSALPFPSLQLLSRNLTCVQFVLFLPGFMRLSRTSYLVGDHLVTLSLSRNTWACLPFGTNCCKLCLFVLKDGAWYTCSDSCDLQVCAWQSLLQLFEASLAAIITYLLMLLKCNHWSLLCYV